MQPWWLDATCTPEGTWNVVLAWKNQRVVGVFPYFLKKKGPWHYVAMPQLTRQLGPYLLPEYRTAKFEIPLLTELAEGLPKIAAFEQDFNYSIQNWLPFYWLGYRQTTRYSYRIDLSPPLDALLQGLDADYRNNKLKKAAHSVSCVRGGSLDDFFRIHNMSYARQNIQQSISLPYLTRLYEQAAQHGAASLFFAVDKLDGTLHSTALVVHDRHTVYFLMAGDAPVGRTSGAGIFLVWEIIKWAKSEQKAAYFDFCGSMIPGVERVRRNFGAAIQPYFRVRKEWSWPWKMGKLLWRP